MHIKINDESVSKAATALDYCHAVNWASVEVLLWRRAKWQCRFEQMEAKNKRGKLFGTSEGVGGAILPIGGSGSCCLSTSFGASAAI